MMAMFLPSKVKQGLPHFKSSSSPNSRSNARSFSISPRQALARPTNASTLGLCVLIGSPQHRVDRTRRLETRTKRAGVVFVGHAHVEVEHVGRGAPQGGMRPWLRADQLGHLSMNPGSPLGREGARTHG